MLYQQQLVIQHQSSTVTNNFILYILIIIQKCVLANSRKQMLIIVSQMITKKDSSCLNNCLMVCFAGNHDRGYSKSKKLKTDYRTQKILSALMRLISALLNFHNILLCHFGYKISLVLYHYERNLKVDKLIISEHETSRRTSLYSSH